MHVAQARSREVQLVVLVALVGVAVALSVVAAVTVAQDWVRDRRATTQVTVPVTAPPPPALRAGAVEVLDHLETTPTLAPLLGEHVVGANLRVLEVVVPGVYWLGEPDGQRVLVVEAPIATVGSRVSRVEPGAVVEVRGTFRDVAQLAEVDGFDREDLDRLAAQQAFVLASFFTLAEERQAPAA